MQVHLKPWHQSDQINAMQNLLLSFQELWMWCLIELLQVSQLKTQDYCKLMGYSANCPQTASIETTKVITTDTTIFSPALEATLTIVMIVGIETTSHQPVTTTSKIVMPKNTGIPVLSHYLVLDLMICKNHSAMAFIFIMIKRGALVSSITGAPLCFKGSTIALLPIKEHLPPSPAHINMPAQSKPFMVATKKSWK